MIAFCALYIELKYIYIYMYIYLILLYYSSIVVAALFVLCSSLVDVVVVYCYCFVVNPFCPPSTGFMLSLTIV